MLFKIGVECRILYCLVGWYSKLITSVGEGDLIFLVLCIPSFVVSVGRNFLFFLVLEKGCVVALLWLTIFLKYAHIISWHFTSVKIDDF